MGKLVAHRITLSLSPAEAKEFRAYCENVERTVSWVVRRLLREAGIIATPGGADSSQKTAPGAALSKGDA